jgi:hypothetical protein
MNEWIKGNLPEGSLLCESDGFVAFPESSGAIWARVYFDDRLTRIELVDCEILYAQEPGFAAVQSALAFAQRIEQQRLGAN